MLHSQGAQDDPDIQQQTPLQVTWLAAQIELIPGGPQDQGEGLYRGHAAPSH